MNKSLAELSILVPPTAILDVITISISDPLRRAPGGPAGDLRIRLRCELEFVPSAREDAEPTDPGEEGNPEDAELAACWIDYGGESG